MRASRIKAIAQVGAIVAGAVRHATDPSDILAPLREIASFDAAMLAVRDPLSGRQHPLVNLGLRTVVAAERHLPVQALPGVSLMLRAHRPS